MLQAHDHYQLAGDFNKMFQNMIRFSSVISNQIKTQFTRTMLEQVVSLSGP